MIVQLGDKIAAVPDLRIAMAAMAGHARGRERPPARAFQPIARYAAAAHAHRPSVAPLPSTASARSLGTSRVWPLRQTTV